jgi:very-short-patch-repair endonuclease
VPIYIPDCCRALIALQRGVIGRQQALESGLGSDSIDNLIRTGRWQRVHRGIYKAFTGPPCREAVLLAALLRAGPDAALSHRTAAGLLGLAKNEDDRPIHVTVPRNAHPTRIKGVIIHRTDRAVAARDPYMFPACTRIEDTVLDLAESSRTADEAYGWVYRAAGKWLVTGQQLREALGPRSKMRWRAELLSALDAVDDGVRSNLEHRYVSDVERPHRLPKATRQARVIRYGRPCYLDNLYEDYLVCVELDGLEAHPRDERWRDFRRDNAGAADGIITLRYGWPDVTQSPCSVAGQVAAVLRQRGWSGPGRRCGPGCGLR